VRVTPAVYFVKEPSSSRSEPTRELSESVSIPASSGAAQAASHPNVKHITDTLVRMHKDTELLVASAFLMSPPLAVCRQPGPVSLSNTACRLLIGRNFERHGRAPVTQVFKSGCTLLPTLRQ
jgi:hypothetical protein